MEDENRNETGLGLGRGMERGPLRQLVGESERGSRTLEAIVAGLNGARDPGAEETGRDSWNQERFLGIIEVVARENGAWIDNIKTITQKSLGRGQENEVHLAKDGKMVIKVNNLSLVDNMEEFIDRLQAHNLLFGRTVPYKIIGVSKNSKGEVGIVLEQPYVHEGIPADEEKIESFLSRNGFNLTYEEGIKVWVKDKFLISDTYPRNVLEDRDGNLHFIDAIIRVSKGVDVMPDFMEDDDAIAVDFESMDTGSFIDFSIEEETPDEEIRYRQQEEESKEYKIKDIINEKGEINYGQLNKTTDAIIDGRVRFDRLLVAVEAQRNRWGRRNIEATAVALAARSRGIQETDTAGTSRAPRGAYSLDIDDNNTRRQEEVALVKWAKHQDIFVEPETIAREWEVDYLNNGSEAIVYFGDAPGTVKKIYDPYLFSDTPLDFLDNRVALFNYLYPANSYELVGITTNNSNIRFILQQPYVSAKAVWEKMRDDPDVMDRFREEMQRSGLVFDHRRSSNTYFNDDFFIYDLHGNNVMETSDGIFHVIDAVTELNTPRHGGTRTYGSEFLVDTDNEIIRYREDYEQQARTPGMGNAGTMGSNAVRELLGESERDGRILETIAASYTGTGNERTKTLSKDPERNKFRYLERLKKEAIKRDTWIEDIGSITREGKMFARGAENTVYLSKDEKNVIKVNNLMFGLCVLV